MKGKSEVKMNNSNQAGLSDELPTWKIFPKPFEEYLGFYQGTRVSEDDTAVILSLTKGQKLHILFLKGSREERIILEELQGDMVGKKIGIMKVDNRENPVLVREILSQG